MKHLITIFLILFSFSAYSEEPAYKDWSDDLICDKAWYDGQWTDDEDLIDFVKEAKARNLDCLNLHYQPEIINYFRPMIKGEDCPGVPSFEKSIV